MPQHSPTISVIIPCYNDGKYIQEAVDSVLDQTIEDYEVIIINDGSSDLYTNRYLQSIKHKKIQLISLNRNEGLSNARNIGIESAKGKYILPLDADDKIAPSYLEKAKKILDGKKEIGIVYCNAEYFGTIQGKWFLPQYSFPEILAGNMIFATAMFRKNDWIAVNGYNKNMRYGNEDYDFWLSLIEWGKEVYKIEETLFYYRKKESSMVTDLANDRDKEIESYVQLFNNHKKLYTDNIDVLFRDRRDQIQDRDKQLQERDAEIARKIEENNQRDVMLQDRDKQIQERDAEIARRIDENNQRDVMIQDRDKQIQERDAEMARKIEENNQKDVMIQKQESLIHEKDQLINELLNSSSMKITRPMRQFVFVSKTLLNFKQDKIYIQGTDEHRFVQAIKRRVPEKLFLKIKSFIKKDIPQNQQDMPWSKSLTSISKDLGKRVLIIAELSLPQCKKYRVDQKVEMLEYLGYDVRVVSWNDSVLCRQFLQLHGLIIFYRVPGFDSVIELLEEAKRLNIVTFFDVDDLIFDRELMTQNENINKLKSQELEEILNGADLYQSVLSSVDHIISSTHTLGEQMKRYNDGNLYIIKNCLDDQLYNFATTHSIIKSQGNEVKIVYGSGTSTHDEDFLEVADALVQILQKYSNVKLYIHGILSLPSIFDNISEQVIKVPFSNADEYYRSLSSYDINIAPLETSIFNDAKSNIKFLEAAIFKTPTVASRAAEFIDVIDNTKNGFLADNNQEWFNALEVLVLDKELRNRIGERAYEIALEQYSLEQVATNSFKPLLDKYLPQKKKKRKKILMVNILFQPISFGGATIVVEELARLLDLKEEFEVTVFTGFWDSGGYPILEYGLVRYEANGLPIIAVRFPSMTPELEYKNNHMENIFEDVLKTVQPDLVHFHSIQQLSASLATSCQRQNTPYTITLHDMWWLCEKQFMVMPNNKYCHQSKIDTDFCINNCTKNIIFTEERTKFLKPILQNADLLLAPSVFQAEMYLHNELAPNKVKVNKNGIQFPLDGFKKTKSDKVRFSYLGGNAVHKGYNHIKEIFESITESNYELVLVDLHRKLGHNSIFESDWNISGQLTISDGYEYGQKGLDDFFSSMDVLLFPSQGKESFGLTIREALVRDVWVISTDAGGVVEDIVEGENGNIIALTDAHDYKEKIEACLNKSEFFYDYTNPHKNQIRSYDEQAHELVEYYNSILD